ncbi:MAG: sulfur carrier protein ThiS [Planctomycetaceae bacterium]|jgi:sulfur carrier protein|nr:sulfur carrier protein ThiS [Planctomycetaceae bacterium]MBN8601692.1 sulfur carrier protein ThiS [Planctomycetota bacterium]
MDNPITIVFNGQDRQISAGLTVEQLLQEAAINSRFVAVELNGEILPRDQRNQREVQARDVIEVVTLVGGG